MKKKKVVLGLCFSFVILLALCLYLFTCNDNGKISPCETKLVYSMPIGENEDVSVRRIIVTDLTGDGLKDILISCDVRSIEYQIEDGITNMVVSFKEARIIVLSSDEKGEFQKFWEYDSGLTKQTAATGDFDGDNKVDIVIGGFEMGDGESSMFTTSRVDVLFQTEDGFFDNVFSSDLTDFFVPGDIVTGDFDEDGRMDFVLSGFAVEDESVHHAYFFKNNGEGDFTLFPIAMRERLIVEHMWKGDVNNDGYPDLIMQVTDRYNEDQSVVALLNNGQGGFEFKEINLSFPIYMMVVEDFTGDGYPDIICEEPGETKCNLWFLENNKGQFKEPEQINVLFGGGGDLTGMVSGNLDNDNTPDVLFLEQCPNNSSGLNTTGYLLQVTNDKEELFFSIGWTYAVLGEGNIISSRFAGTATDINDDGWNDLILVSRDGGVYITLIK